MGHGTWVMVQGYDLYNTWVMVQGNDSYGTWVMVHCIALQYITLYNMLIYVPYLLYINYA